MSKQWNIRTQRITTTKNGKNRTVYLPSQLSQILKDRKEDLLKYDGFSESWYILGDWSHLPSHTLRNWLREDLARCPDLKPITLHGFRHSHASALINAGMDDSLIADRLGHTVDVLHKTYAHIYEERKIAMADETEKLFVIFSS